MIFQPSKYSNENYGVVPSDTAARDRTILIGGGLTLVSLLLVGPLMVTPWIVKQFKPEWPYGKRVATGFVVSFGVGALTGVVRAASGASEKE